MNEAQVRKIIREELKDLLGFYKYTFQHQIDIFDGINLKLGSNTGTQIGTEETQKLAFYGATPIVRQDAITKEEGGVVQDAGARDMCYDIIDFLTLIGLTK